MYQKDVDDFGPEMAFDYESRDPLGDRRRHAPGVDLRRVRRAPDDRQGADRRGLPGPHPAVRAPVPRRPARDWTTFLSGTTLGEKFEKTFAPITAREVRLNILEATEGPTINEIQWLEK